MHKKPTQATSLRISNHFRFLSVATFLVCMVAMYLLGVAHAMEKPPYPVIFIHGIASDHGTWDSIKAGLKSEGWVHGGNPTVGSLAGLGPGDFYTLYFSDNTDLSFAEQGCELASIIKSITFWYSKNKVILVGHSMGGMAARAYLQGAAKCGGGNTIDYGDDVAALVTIGTPHRGSEIATYYRLPEACLLNSSYLCSFMLLAIPKTDQGIVSLDPGSNEYLKLNSGQPRVLPAGVIYGSIIVKGRGSPSNKILSKLSAAYAGLGNGSDGDGIVTAASQNMQGLPFASGAVHYPFTVTGDCTGFLDSYLGLSLNELLAGEVHTCETTDPSVNGLLYGLLAQAYVVAPNPPSSTRTLNDTGITACGNAASNGLSCPQSGYPSQDAENGRDARALAGTLTKVGGGRAGFDFTKIDANGNALAASAASWVCVRDNVTGLLWENKTDDGGIHDKDWTYTWYNTDATTNGGSAGSLGSNTCGGTLSGYSNQCNTANFVAVVNSQSLCGNSDWRLPAREELHSIFDYSIPQPGPTIDTAYFTNTTDYFANMWSRSFWSASPDAGNSVSVSAWYVDFSGVYQDDAFKSNAINLRLVRGGR